MFTDDREFLAGIWGNYTLGVEYMINKIDSTGMLFVTGTDDWGRLSQGGYNTEANMLMYRVLVTGSLLSKWMGDITLSIEWADLAARLKDATFRMTFDAVER